MLDELAFLNRSPDDGILNDAGPSPMDEPPREAGSARSTVISMPPVERTDAFSPGSLLSTIEPPTLPSMPRMFLATSLF